MKANLISAKPTMTMLTALLASCVVVSCGGGSGGGATSGSQSVTPSSSTTTVAAASAATATAEAAASAASSPTAASTTVKTGDTATSPSSSSNSSTASSSGTAGTSVVAAPPVTATNSSPSAAATASNSDTSTATSPAQAATAEVPTATATAALATEAVTTANALQSRVDRLKAAIDSMKVAKHEALPACAPCYGWGVKPLVVMGTEPYASALPPNWPGLKFADWKGMGSWFVIYEGTKGNTATNTAVEVGGIELWYLSKTTKTWRLVQSAPLPKWDMAVGPDTVSLNATPLVRVTGAASISYVPTATSVAHGGLPLTETPWNTATNKSDIDAIYLSVRHRLALRNPTSVDDRASANYVLNAGADYMPTMFTRVRDLNANYAPGAGQGQYIKVTPQWRHSTLFLKSPSISEAQILSIQPPTFLH